jgi:hypothetical protein
LTMFFLFNEFKNDFIFFHVWLLKEAQNKP